MFKFLTTRPFWVNLLAAFLFVLLIIFGFLQLLGLITRHGEYLTVPSVTGKPTSEAIKFLEEKGFEVLIQDSVYVDTAKRGIVLKQLPDPNSTVKVNRTVYLTVNRVTLPLVEMPALEGKTYSFALEILRRSHLEAGDTTHKPDFMRGSILEQLYKGNKITSGTRIPWGSKIDLVIAGGLEDIRIQVPDIVGMTFGEAKLILEQTGVAVALITDPDVRDTVGAYVYRQSPPRYTEDKEPVYIQPGQLMDVWISREMKVQRDSTDY